MGELAREPERQGPMCLDQPVTELSLTCSPVFLEAAANTLCVEIVLR